MAGTEASRLWQLNLFRVARRVNAGVTSKRFRYLLLAGVACVRWTTTASAIPKPHVITFGKWTAAKWLAGSAADSKPLDLTIRRLYVDTRLNEYTTGAPHDVTDRLFVVRRVFRLNDTLPNETAPTLRWQWERRGGLLWIG